MAFRFQKGKYGAKRVVVDGVSFQSKREGSRYRQLQLLVRAGVITDLQLQVPFPIDTVNLETGEVQTVAKYLADFVYRQEGRTVIEDVKGMKTETYRLKKKLVEAIHGVRITEV